jgi:hypothetical protein
MLMNLKEDWKRFGKACALNTQQHQQFHSTMNEITCPRAWTGIKE